MRTVCTTPDGTESSCNHVSLKIVADIQAHRHTGTRGVSGLFLRWESAQTVDMLKEDYECIGLNLKRCSDDIS
jgi:hypothetical protein